MAVARTEVAELAGAVMTLVNRVRRGQARAFNPELVAVLELLRSRGELTPSEIAEGLPAPRSSVSRRVKALAGQGWVAVAEARADGRSYVVRLTEEGGAELDRLRAEGLEVFAELVADWSARDIRTYIALTRRLAEVTPSAATRQRPQPWWKEQTR